MIRQPYSILRRHARQENGRIVDLISCETAIRAGVLT